MALNPHGSGLPGTLEGAPFHNDSFLLSFLAVANANSVAVFIGAVVTLDLVGGADFTCRVTLANTEFILGVAQTSGQLQSAIDVICRGEVTVLVHTTVAVGDYLMPSTTDGLVDASSIGATRLIALQSVTYAGTPLPIVALLY